MDDSNEICIYREWDSHFFGLRIAQVVPSSLTAALIKRLTQWCDQNDINCLYFLVEWHDMDSIKLAESSGFHLVDIRVTLEAEINKPEFIRPTDSHISIGAYAPCHLAELQTMAGRNHTDSRFFTDGRFPREKCAEMYALWIKKCCTEYGDTVFVASLDGATAGYIACRREAGGAGSIILAGVREEARNHGIGTHLVLAARQWFREQGAAPARVVTQGANVPAMRLYTSMGFYPRHIQLWYHRWFTEK